jgi:hypothetical protein
MILHHKSYTFSTTDKAKYAAIPMLTRSYLVLPLLLKLHPYILDNNKKPAQPYGLRVLYFFWIS